MCLIAKAFAQGRRRRDAEDVIEPVDAATRARRAGFPAARSSAANTIRAPMVPDRAPS